MAFAAFSGLGKIGGDRSNRFCRCSKMGELTVHIIYKRLAAAVLIASPVLATQAQATTVIYTITGTATGNYIGGAGGSFTNAAFTITLTGDSANLSVPPPGPYLSTSTGTIAIAGFATNTFLNPLFLSSPNTGTVALGGVSVGPQYSFKLASPQALVASFGPVASTGVVQNFGLVGTNGGFVTFTNSSNVQFSGQIGPVAAVPEPTTWAMMIGGFGLIGAAMRRRVSKVSYLTA